MSSGAERPSVWRQLRAIALLPAMTAIVIPAFLLYLNEEDIGWGLPGAAAVAPVLGGTALIALGLRLMYQTISLFSKVGEGTLAPWDPPRQLVVRGPYRHVRNPMITGVGTVILGEAVAFGSPSILTWFALFALGNAIYQPLFEEPGLVRRFGDRYRAYRREVPRWIPRRKPWPP
jgi:protein-S-isoprenylcysteine O-methyltransferase Ste14